MRRVQGLKTKRCLASRGTGQALRRADACSGQVLRRADACSGQALVELAVFGSIFLLLLGALISYGLKYNFQQEAQMVAFRRALKIAADPNRGSATYMLMQDKHIPDPMHPFGIGTTMPIVASASVTRDADGGSPADEASLPKMVMDVQTKNNNGNQEWMRRVFNNAGFRIEKKVPTDKNTINKYFKIFGSVQARANNGGWVSADSEHPTNSEAKTTCTEWSQECNAVGAGEGCTPTCLSYVYDEIRITDSCSGNMPDYKACYKQARMITEPQFCTDECNRNKASGDDTNCSNVCSAVTHPPNQDPNQKYNKANGGAWYAADWTLKDNVYDFPVLNEMFNKFGKGAANTKSMGIQSDTTSNSSRDESITKIETGSLIVSEESMNWTERWNRTLVHQENLYANGYEIPHDDPNAFINIQQDAVQSVVSGETDQTWKTEK